MWPTIVKVCEVYPHSCSVIMTLYPSMDKVNICSVFLFMITRLDKYLRLNGNSLYLSNNLKTILKGNECV